MKMELLLILRYLKYQGSYLGLFKMWEVSIGVKFFMRDYKREVVTGLVVLLLLNDLVLLVLVSFLDIMFTLFICCS